VIRTLFVVGGLLMCAGMTVGAVPEDRVAVALTSLGWFFLVWAAAEIMRRVSR